MIIRPAVPHDARGVAEVHVASWRAAYAGLIDQAVLDAQSVDGRQEMWASWIVRSEAGLPPVGYDVPVHRMLVADDDGVITGWATFGPGRDEGTSGLGELAGLYAHPAAWSTGVGHALVTRAAESLVKDGFDEAFLWVLHGNQRASRFCERHGWIADGTEKTADAGGAKDLRELRHTRRLSDGSA
ncbi:MAG: GNAT family N-acetyltransferase [Microbacterium sp.]|uniref:GNAT family N-acetyltransferase n=1 Tax=Microbacterium sp. TaxID=51671 RepID=UPI001D45F809|nr:GNAT family N-acetyltransferase [Microbacterium sp.]MBW8763448.1 GNAT family N-acetyltransferase [Microbacterium sp.]